MGRVTMAEEERDVVLRIAEQSGFRLICGHSGQPEYVARPGIGEDFTGLLCVFYARALNSMFGESYMVTRLEDDDGHSNETG